MAACPCLREVAVEGDPADTEALGDLGHGDVAGSQKGARYLEVPLREGFGPAALTPASEGSLQAFHGAFAVEVEEVLSHGPMHLQGEASVGSGAVELLGQGAEVDLLDPETVDRTHHLDEGAAQAIELPDHQDVCGTEIGEGGLELRAFGPSLAALLLLEDPLATGLGQRIALQVQVLILGRDAGISDEHVRIVSQYPYPNNRLPIIFSLHKRGRFAALERRRCRLSGKRSFCLQIKQLASITICGMSVQP